MTICGWPVPPPCEVFPALWTVMICLEPGVRVAPLAARMMVLPGGATRIVCWLPPVENTYKYKIELCLWLEYV